MYQRLYSGPGRLFSHSLLTPTFIDTPLRITWNNQTVLMINSTENFKSEPFEICFCSASHSKSNFVLSKRNTWTNSGEHFRTGDLSKVNRSPVHKGTICFLWGEKKVTPNALCQIIIGGSVVGLFPNKTWGREMPPVVYLFKSCRKKSSPHLKENLVYKSVMHDSNWI